MFNIRNEQLEVISQNQELVFVKKICKFSREKLPEICEPYTDQMLMCIIKKSIHDTKNIGLTWQNNIATICLLDITFKACVLEDPELREYILDSANPDIYFRHLFTEPSSNIWNKFSTEEPGKEMPAHEWF